LLLECGEVYTINKTLLEDSIGELDSVVFPSTVIVDVEENVVVSCRCCLAVLFSPLADLPEELYILLVLILFFKINPRRPIISESAEPVSECFTKW